MVTPTIVTQMIAILVSGITGIASGIGTGVTSLVQNLFLSGSGTTESPYTLNIFAIMVLSFAGISLAVGLCRWVMNFLTSLGAKN